MKLLNKQLYILLILLLLISYFNQAKDPSLASAPQRLTVAVSIVPQATFVQQVAGDLVDIVVLIPPGNSPTNYIPSPKELIQLSNATLYFTIGVPTENANILTKLDSINKNIKVIELADEVAKIYPEKVISPGSRDPHIWLSPKRVRIMIDVIASELSSIDPRNKEIYMHNASNYKSKLDALDQDMKMTISKLPQKEFLVYHPSFGYLADDYGLNMIAIEKNGKEATIEGLREIIDWAKKNNIRVVFYQAEIDSAQTETIAKEIGAVTALISPLAPDYINNIKNITQKFAQTFN